MKCCDITAGMLRNTITIEREEYVGNNSGGQDIVWNTLLTIKAKIEPKSGSERVRGMQLESPVTHDIMIRYVAGILPTDRINFNGRLFQIRATLNVEERNRWWQLKCEEGVAQ